MLDPRFSFFTRSEITNFGLPNSINSINSIQYSANNKLPFNLSTLIAIAISKTYILRT